MSIVDRLDNYYYSKKPNEVWLMVILVAVLIGYLLYLLLSDYAYNFRVTQEDRFNNLTNKIEEDKSYLRSITINGDRDYYIKELSRSIVKKRVELNEYRAKLAKLDGAVKKLSNILYNNGNWSKFLHSIAQKAEDNNLKVYNISNIAYDSNKTFAKVLDVNIKCKGKYGEILSFLNELEKTELVANVSRLNLKSTTNAPVADINLTIWGIKP